MSKQDRQFLQRYVEGKITYLRDQARDAERKKCLAIMRRGIGKKPGDDPALWGMLFEEMPENYIGRKEGPEELEWAIYATLTLYALHQQGKDIKELPMHLPGQSLGKACALLTLKDLDSQEAVRRRFNAVATAQNIEALLHHLRMLVQILKSKDIPLDYISLAQDLWLYQLPNRDENVRLAWGRAYYACLYHEQKEESEKREEQTDEKR